MTANALSMSSYTDGIHQAAASSTQAVTPTMDSNNNNNIQHNPFLQQEGLPKFSKIKPHHLTPAIDFTVAQSQIDFQQLENALSPSSINNGETTAIEYDQVLPQLERIKFPLEYTWSVASHLTAVKNSNELRKEYESNQGKVIQAMAQFAQSKSLYNALLEVQKNLLDQESSATASFLMKQKRRAVELTLRSMKHGGVGLEGSKKERLNEIKLRLATLSTSFSNNILDETQAFSLTINDSKSLRGVPESAKRLWHNAHRQFVTRSSGRDSNSSNGALGYVSWGGNGPMTYEEELYEEEYGSFGWTIGPWRITLDQPSYLAAMMHIPDRNLRQQIYMAHAQRASEASPSKNNIPVINEMLQLKNEMANILGYDNYVELSLSSKMASSKEAITELTDLVAEKAVPAAKRELEEIATFAIGYGGVEYHAKPLEPWDIPYWTERLKESKFDLTEEEIRPYFALPNVLDGLFQLVDRLFDVSIQEQRYAGETWHLDVSFYNMIDNISGQHIASFYLDPYSRPANKRGGAWMSSCIGKSSAVNRELPVAYVTCNINPPNKGKPSLLTFREVQSLFHEFGHALQHLLTKATVGAVSGINGIEWDAVEVPSQFMERWCCHDRDTFYSFAKHWRTNLPLPEEKYEKLILQQTSFHAGMSTCKQLYFGQLDLALHSSPACNIFDISSKIASKYMPHVLPKGEDRFLCSFSHIFGGGGYAGGYYSYLWAEVMSADAFAAFQEGEKNQGRSLRDTFLSMGGGLPPSEVFELFRGRAPTPTALLQHLDLS